MKIAILHAGNTGFFPRYYKAINAAAKACGDDVTLFAPNSGRNNRTVLPNQQLWGTRFNWFVHSRLYKLTGIQDVFSVVETRLLIRKLKQYQPDVLHFNVINDKIINIPMLVNFINKHSIPVIWTMHDCRAFTGQCPYFDEVGCVKWKTGCGKCPLCETKIDNTHLTWKIRRKYHAGIRNLTIVTPSQWLADFVKESVFKEHPVEVIYNGVDLNGFSAQVDCDVRKMYHIPESTHIVLGCAINWEERKGLVYFEKLADMLPPEYRIVLLGNINPDKKKQLHDNNIICTGRTQTFKELVAWYQTASVFCNPTLADNFPTVNIEALASGTPVVTFKTGGSPEAIDENTGIVVEQGDVDALYDAIINVTTHRTIYTSEDCKRRSLLFSNLRYSSYVHLYHKLVSLS